MIQNEQINRRQLVLLVDDQEINRDILEEILGDRYEVLFAENGKEALELMRAHANELSLVLLDLMMPIMGGVEVLQIARADEKLKDIPVIVLTADKTAELQALQLGAADFIAKPFEVAEIILARVGRIIELSEGRQLISAAETDALTGLYSRNFFLEYADRLFHFHPELHMDAVVLNIEQFHTVNATNGRDYGDEVLRLIGREIQAFLSQTEGIAGRFEADRFDIYCLPQPDYRALLNELQSRISAVTPNVNIHLRMGVSPWQEGVEPVLLFDQAYAACNKVRGDYQNPLMVYDEFMRERETMDRRLLNDLRAAIEERQFLVYYQPKYKIQTDPPRLSSAEALIRWRHPELGMISPGAFITLFERNGLISLVDSYVWEEAARQVAAWKEKFGRLLPVSVNLSRADVYDPTLIERLRHLIESNGLTYDSIKLEVTESAYTENTKHVLTVIRELREMGFEIEMDDFGSGYSSLNMLSDMPIDVLKMDMKFVRQIEANETDLSLVKLVLDIARFMRLRAVAEGVETEGQFELLKAAGCDLVQGYYFSKPLPPEEFEKLIEQDIAIEKEMQA